MGKGRKDHGENEKRSYFRIDDVISVVANPVEIDLENLDEFKKCIVSSKAFAMTDSSVEPEGFPGDNGDISENRKLYEMLAEIKSKVDYIINHLMIEKEGLFTTAKKRVNISASGIRFTTEQEANVGDVMEIKLLLPTFPPVAVFAYGRVTRIKKLKNGKSDIALEYLNMSESVRNEIVRYTLEHQREMIRKMKEAGACE
jgi:hypothetical protein